MKKLPGIIVLLVILINLCSVTTFGCPFPAPVFSGTTTVCGKSVNTYDVTNSTYFKTYNWKVKGGTIISGQGTKSVSVRWLDSGMASLTVVTEDNSVCTDSSQQLITIKTLPATNNSKNILTVCYGDTIRLSEPECKTCTYTWHDTRYIHLGLPSLSSKYYYDYVPKPGSSNKDFLVIFKVAITDPATKCTVNDTIRVMLKATVAPKLTGANSVCINATETYSFTNTNAPDSFKWIVENGTILSGEGTKSISVNWNKAGAGKVKLLAYLNCIETSTINVNIYEKPNPVIQLASGACMGNTEKYSVAKNTAQTYKWIVSGGSIVGSDARDSVYIKWNTTGTTFRLSVTATNTTNCLGYTLEEITLHPKPVAAFTVSATEACAGSSFSFTNTSTNADSFFWSFGDGNFSQLQNPDHIFTAAGTYNVRLFTKGKGNCADSAKRVITIHPKPAIKIINGLTNAKAKDTAMYFINSSAGNTYLWNIKGGKILQYGSSTDTLAIVVWDTVGTGSLEVTETTNKLCGGPVNKLLVNVDNNVSVQESKAKAIGLLKVFPNPVSTVINVIYESRLKERAAILLTDAMGKTVYKVEKQNVEKGKNVLSINTTQFYLPQGVYYLSLITPSGTTCQKIIKL